MFTNSITAYETSQTQKSAYRYALEQDAQHIKTLGKTFEQVDQSIANILTAGLLGD
jgi:type VII secretion effector (TIGR04197 family)